MDNHSCPVDLGEMALLTSPGEDLTDRGMRRVVRYGGRVCGRVCILNHGYYPIPGVSWRAEEAPWDRW